ncbi:MAG: chemotaxis protein CheA [Deltaproteobacteria bacterium]|nr:chemotaxis protein CheA [Deltaproteobacteria bacterium]
MKKSLKLKDLSKQIDSLALSTVMLDPEDIAGLGDVLKSLESVEELLKDVREDSLKTLAGAMKGYIEGIILGEKSDLSPFESGISQLQEMCRDLVNEVEFDRDVSSLLIRLGCEGIEPSAMSSSPEKEKLTEAKENLQESEMTDSGDEREEAGADTARSIMLGDEDREIISDFVGESLENLGTIEVKVMDLEQDPSDLETINAIFRPFHTVKGVSGFLNFNKINNLAHIVESLLDKGRDGKIRIEGGIIDIILDSVDILKRMIENVQASLDTGNPMEGDIDASEVIARVENLIKEAEGGGNSSIGEMLVEKGTVSQTDVEDALDIQKEEHDKKIGEILVEQKKVETKEVVSALREQKRSGRPVALHVKVDTGKLDSVVDMVGELAIAQSMLRQNELIRMSRDRKVDQIINQLNLITSGLQKTAMSLRMEPIRNTFQKMLRLVRDLAKKAGKEARLVMSGEDTEIDRNMVEEIYEPMVHMIRNSIDHGLELPDEREEAGKPGQGTIYLRAFHKGADIVIEIADDGRGLDRDKILKKAISSGLIKEGQKLTDGEINSLIFHPGFSTAEKITDISGRGVGMDVVRSKIVEKLRGRVEVHSVSGEGTTAIIRLPLTLAIVNGMIVKVTGERYIIPTLAVQESFRPRRAECYTVEGKKEMIKVRDNLIRLIRLDRLLGVNGNCHPNGADTPPWEGLVVVVENQERKTGLLVDELLGEEEVVIKNLGGWLREVKGIAGGAIMGDGRVGLILDIAGILAIASGE